MEIKKSSPLSLQKLKQPVFLAIVFCLFLAGLFSLNSFFVVKTIEVRKSRGMREVAGLREYKSKNLILLNSEEVKNELKKKNPYLKSVKVEKKYPSALLLYPEFYEPKAMLQVSTGYFILSEDSRILLKTNKIQEQLTLINYYQKLNFYSYSSGDYLDLRDIKLGVSFTVALATLGYDVDILDINDSDMLLCNVGDKTIIFTTAKDAKLQLYELREIIRQFKIKGNDFKSIDLRFEKPIIRL